ncbi:MAG: (deoxy)nucleoside triphosphate pyrophosphohydrolase [Saprospirales bacterium]|nr:(deoxy)nucleoside triphosphate pyrophosphohydrolase [Saprospirales bacterium]MBK8489739.1 (deoxy)nucleoside triphosphate pyrophosphohydrolase [Saprospirales bacterium]
MIHVTCALIERDGLVLAAQRSGTMRLPWKWEFPGGKQEPGETLETCIIREIKEELDLDIHITGAMSSQTHINQKGMEICLHPFLCTIIGGELLLKEHAQIKWLPPQELPTLDWAEADVPVLGSYLAKLAAD